MISSYRSKGKRGPKPWMKEDINELGVQDSTGEIRPIMSLCLLGPITVLGPWYDDEVKKEEAICKNV
jgi:hypothetical protein